MLIFIETVFSTIYKSSPQYLYCFQASKCVRCSFNVTEKALWKDFLFNTLENNVWIFFNRSGLSSVDSNPGMAETEQQV